MKQFLKKVFIFSLPILFGVIIMEFLLRNIPNDYSYKNNYLKKNAHKIQTLFLGSSHTYYGINPEYFSGNSFNASHISQSIDLDYKLIKKYSQNFKSLEYIVVPIDYFTLFSRTSTGIESWRMKNYDIYYNLNTSTNYKDHFEVMSFSLKRNITRIARYYLTKDDNITCSKLGYGKPVKKRADLIETGKTASKRHTKKDKSYLKESIEIINKIISYGQENNISILFYTSPAYYTYRENLDSIQYYTTINIIDSIVSTHKNSYYHNLIADSSFIADDFRDADHLNSNGAKKLTGIVNDLINSIKRERTIE